MMKTMSEMTIEKAGNLVLDKAAEQIVQYREKKQWGKLLVNTNEFLLKKVEQGDQLLSEIADYLSGEELKTVANKLTQESKYNLIEKLHFELTRIMMKYEIPKNEAEFYIAGFLTVILHELEKINPATYQCVYLGDWRKKEEESLQQVRKELSVISGAISEIKRKEIQVFTSEQMEVSLYKDTINPSLNLEFFEIDDEAFQDSFAESLNETNIYIKGQCKEETIYCVLNELRRIRPNKMVFVVRSEEDWKKLRIANEENKTLGGKILIPWFYAEQILSIPGNTNVFVFGSEEHPVGKPVIELRKRKRGTVRECLQKLGMDYEKAYKLVENTHGLYIPMKKQLINGIDLKSPNWLQGDMKIIIPLLLCGKWTESDGDIMVIEDLCGMKYKEILQSIQEYINGENPLFVKFTEYGRRIVHLASVENAWGYLDSFVSFGDELWNKYVSLITAIVTEEDPSYSFPKHQQRYANLLPRGTFCWSTTLKEGLLRSLVMKAYLNNNACNQTEVDRVVSLILNEVKTQNQWLSIAKLFPVLSEASPVAVKNRLDAEWGKNTGLKEVFVGANDEGIFAKNEYTHFLWGIEQFLCQKEYALWSIRWLFRMNELRKEYPITNSPYETLKQIFCPWYNTTVLSQQEKIYLAKEAFTKKYDVWDLFYSELPMINTSMVNTISHPKYRVVSEPKELTNGEVWNAYNEYTDLCLNNMDYMVSRWEKMIGHINHCLSEETVKKIVDRLLLDSSAMSDKEKASIKEKIREEIYRNRYYNSSEWAMKEKSIGILENALSQIQVDNPIYDYRYLFKYQYNFPLMNPFPFEEDSRHDQNKELAEREIQQGIERFIKNGFDPIELAKICAECKNSTLGKYMFLFVPGERFSVDLYVQMLADETLKDIMLDYVAAAYRVSSDNLYEAYHIAKKCRANDETLSRILLVENVNESHHPLILDADAKIKKYYWKSYRGGYSISNKEVALMVINEMLLYSDQMCLLEMLFSCSDFLEEDEILHTLERGKELEEGNELSLSRYHAEKLFMILQKAYIDTDNCVRVAFLEWYYHGLIGAERMRCFIKCLSDSPAILLQMLALIFKTDDGNIVEGVTIDKSRTSEVFSIYYELKFCPAKEDKGINPEKLTKWITDFEEGLKRNKQLRLFDSIIGRLFAYSPIGKDGMYPAEEIRRVIEERHSKELEDAYATAVFNSRGVYSSTGGSAERKMALDYKKNADALRASYPITAEIYDHLYRWYLHEADSERECDEYAGV